jgi:hypothetical protein
LIGCRREGQFVYSEAIPATMEEYTRALTAFVGGKKRAKSR